MLIFMEGLREACGRNPSFPIHIHRQMMKIHLGSCEGFDSLELDRGLCCKKSSRDSGLVNLAGRLMEFGH